MKCPSCNSENYHVYESDPQLMGCENCHNVQSISWSIGYWVGFCDGKRLTSESTVAPEQIRDGLCRHCGQNWLKYGPCPCVEPPVG